MFGFSLEPAYGIIALLILWHILNYYVLSKLMSLKEEKWKVSLLKGNEYKLFKGGSFLKFYLGFVWRVGVISALTNPVIGGVLGNADGGVFFSIIFTALIIYSAFIWLIKFPYGETRLAFNVLHKHIPVSSERNLPAPVEIESDKRSSDGIIETVTNIITGMGAGLFMLVHFAVGCVQFIAIYDFFREAWDWWSIPSFLAAGFLAYIPIVGNIAAIYTAYVIWDWSLIWALLLFLWPLVLAFLIFILVSISETFSWVKNKGIT